MGAESRLSLDMGLRGSEFGGNRGREGKQPDGMAPIEFEEGVRYVRRTPQLTT